jgi:serine/threonine-protein kinase HipA
LESVAWQLTHHGIEDRDALRRWLAVLVAPGASLGGARPKANFTQTDGTLWIGKFPARDDVYDVAAWEYVAHRLAGAASIAVPAAKLVKLGGGFHTFCVQRFDRAAGTRRFYASAMTLLRKAQSEGASYLELAQFIRSQGDAEYADADLVQLFRRVAFNVAIGNRDDHLRNHGFILNRSGWRLAPAFDVNPNMDKAEHVLNIDDVDNRPDLNTVLETAAFYGLTDTRALEIVRDVVAVASGWRNIARRAGLAAADIDLMGSAFSALARWRASH